MPILPRLSPRRLCVAGLLLVATALVVASVLTAPGPLDAARAKYQRVKVGMTQGQVEAILSDMSPGAVMSSGRCHTTWWYDSRSGATISVDCASGRVTGKDFEEGDQSFRAQVERLKGRLADRLPRGRRAAQLPR
jgi:hypothetical protein